MKDLVDIMEQMDARLPPDPNEEDRCPICGVKYRPEACKCCEVGTVACACGDCDNPRCEFYS